jgi:predicted ArsR family transcriptional regulator
VSTPDEPRDLEAVALLDEPVRRRLYEWVGAQPAAVGRDEAAKALGITRALAAFHLDRLARAGLLDTEYRRLTGRSGPGAGRPAKLYRRSALEVEVSLPQRRYGLAAELFARALENEPRGRPGNRLDGVAHEAGVALGETRRARSSRSPRARVLRVLTDSGYEPVAGEDGTIRLRNCPFHALVAQHRDLTCGMNLSLTRGIVDGLGATGYEPELDPQPGWCCVVLRPADAEATEEAGTG